MPVRVSCQHCEARYNVREDKLGKKVRCQNCGQEFTTSAPTMTPPVKSAAAAHDFHIDTSPQTKPVRSTPSEKSAGSKFWKAVGILAGLFVLSMLIGFLYAPAGVILMMGWFFASLGLIVFGMVRLVMAMEGRQRFWMGLKIFLSLIGFKLFYIDSSLYNKKTLRACGWIGVGFILMIASFLPTSHFLSETRGVVQDEIDETERKLEELARNGFQDDPTLQPPDAFAPPAGQMPPPGFGVGGPPPGFAPPPGINLGYPPGIIPIRFFYESFDHPRSEIPGRVEERFRTFAFYQAGTVRIDENKKLIEFLAGYPPDPNETAQIRTAYAEAGVKLQPR